MLKFVWGAVSRTNLSIYKNERASERKQQVKKNNHDDFDGFMINVLFDEDGDYLAHLVELPNVSAFGATPSQALAELKTAWEFTTGTEWQFLKLAEKRLQIDIEIYPIQRCDKILGILSSMVTQKA